MYYKTTILTIVLLMTAVLGSHAQTGLKVEEVFQQYGHAKGCKMVIMNHARLRGYQLDVYKSLTFRRGASHIATLLNEDRRAAKKIQEVVENGQIISGYYQMPPLPKTANRYVLFSYNDHDGGVVIYIEGKLSPQDIMQLTIKR